MTDRQLHGDLRSYGRRRARALSPRQQALWGQARLVRGRKAPQFGLLAQWAWRDPRILRSAVELAVAKIAK